MGFNFFTQYLVGIETLIRGLSGGAIVQGEFVLDWRQSPQAWREAHLEGRFNNRCGCLTQIHAAHKPTIQIGRVTRSSPRRPSLNNGIDCTLNVKSNVRRIPRELLVR